MQRQKEARRERSLTKMSTFSAVTVLFLGNCMRDLARNAVLRRVLYLPLTCQVLNILYFIVQSSFLSIVSYNKGLFINFSGGGVGRI